MAYALPWYRFTSKAVAEETFRVLRFHGRDSLSEGYRFDVQLVSKEGNLDLEALLREDACFTILREGGDQIFHGMLLEFEQGDSVGSLSFYRAVLVPRLQGLALTHHHQIFLDQSLPEILTALMKDGGLQTGRDFQFRLSGSYEPLDYVCQYDESHLDFLHRWMEREGLYGFFEQDSERESFILTDTRMAHLPLPEKAQLRYRPVSGLDAWHREEIIREFQVELIRPPKRVELRDTHPQTPSLELKGVAEIHPQGRGEHFEFGQHFLNPAQGNRYARFRAEALKCREKTFTGESSVPFLRPGFCFELQDHYREAFNQNFLLLEVEHEGSHGGYLLEGLGLELSDLDRANHYHNRFRAIPADVQYRPDWKSEVPQVQGFIQAKVDAAGSGQFAELDEQGRYKVIMPFDTSGRKDGKASCPLRMMQPNVGPGQGMHFPLPKGTEVLVVFQNGDPDRPLIFGAAPDPEHPSVVNDANATQSVLQSGAGNRLHFEDQPGKERVQLEVPKEKTFMRIGQPNDPWYKDTDEKGKYGITISTPGWISVFCGASDSLVIIENGSYTGGADIKIVLGPRLDTSLARRYNTTIGALTDIAIGRHARLTPAFTQVGPVAQVAAPQRNEAILTHDQIIAAKDDTMLTLAQVAAQKQELRTLKSEIQAFKQQAAASKTRTAASKQTLRATQQEVAAIKTRLHNTRQEAIAAKNQLAGARQRLGVKADQVEALVNQVQGLNAQIQQQVHDLQAARILM